MLSQPAMGSYRAGLRMGVNPSLSMLQQMGQYRSARVAPNVAAFGMQNQQAAYANALRNPMLSLFAPYGGLR